MPVPWSAALEHLAVGIVAMVLAGLRAFAWVALGLALMRRDPGVGPAARSALALLLGAAITGLVLVLGARAGVVGLAMAVDAGLAGAGLWHAGRRAGDVVAGAWGPLAPRSRVERIGLAAVLLLLFVVAIGPPRDADVLRYHLAHVRHILAEGAWRPLPICSFALPFGWSASFLPFEAAGIPQSAHLLNAVVWILALAVCVELVVDETDPRRRRDVAIVVALACTLLPQLLKAATTATSDAPMILAVAVALSLLLRLDALNRTGLLALGFVATVGLQSRHQAAALAGAVAVCVMLHLVRHSRAFHALGGFAAGGAIGIGFGIPFYVVNQHAFGSPVWPLGGAWWPGLDPDLMRLTAECGGRAAAGDIGGAGHPIVRLLLDPTVFPIPLVVVVGLLAIASGRTRIPSVAGVLAASFLALWYAAQPGLTPRFAIYLAPAAFLFVVLLGDQLLSTRFAKLVRAGAVLVLASLVIVTAAYARDYLVLALTGDAHRFHRATWHWPVFAWANRTMPHDARVIVATYGGQTYHLDRWSLSTDIGTTGTLPWHRIGTACELGAALRAHRATHLMYQQDAWSWRVEGQNMARAIADAETTGALRRVATFDLDLVVSRIRGRSVPATVVVYAVDSSATLGPRCARSSANPD
jgi:hypothetical protein